MEHQIIVTNDGSKTIYLPELKETYHSSNGALQEACHVFIKNGLENCTEEEINIFEVGFGTGLNAILAYKFAIENKKKVIYHGIEAFPVSELIAAEMDYFSCIDEEYKSVFEWMHKVEWNIEHAFDSYFSFQKINGKLEEYSLKEAFYNVVFYDAFGPGAQAEMWEVQLLKKMYDGLNENNFLVTYCAKGQVKRDLKSLGFEIEPLQGPPGKREMTRAWKRK